MAKKQYSSILVIAVIAGFVGGAFSSQSPKQDKVIQAQEFLLLDKASKVRALLGLGPGGRVALALFDQKERNRATIGLGPHGNPEILFVDKKGRQVVSLGFAGEEVPFNGGPFLVLLRKGGDPSISLWVHNDPPRPLIMLTDKGGNPRAVINLSPDGSPKLGFKDQTGKFIWKAP